MADQSEVLSFSIEAHDKATQVFRNLGGEVGRMTGVMQGHLRTLGRDMDSLSRHKPIEIIRAEQIVAVKQYEKQLAALNAEARTAGKVSEEQAAKMTLLRRRIEETNAAAALQARQAQGHHRMTTDLVSASVLGAGAAVVGESVKAAVSFDNLQRSVASATGLSGKSLDQFMGTVRKVSASTEFDLNSTAKVAQVLRMRFGETGDALARDTERVLVFAKATGQDASQAMDSLGKTMQAWHVPASQAGTVMDQFLTLAQKTQRPAADLESTLSRYGPSFQAMGLGFKESLTLLGAFSKAGLDASTTARGLSRAVQQAQKEITPSASSGLTPLQKQAEAVHKAQDALKKLQMQTPHTQAAHDKLALSIEAANQKVQQAKAQYDALNTTLQKAGGQHATVQGLIHSEMLALENARSPQDRFNAAVALFGGRAGPQFARALDDGKVSLQQVSAWLDHSAGATDRAGKKLENSTGAQWAKFKNEVHDIAITLGQDFLPALTGVMHVVTEIVQPFGEFVKQNKTLAEILGGGAMAGAGLSLLARHSQLLGAPVRGTLGRLPGPVGSYFGAGGGPGGGGLFGLTGTTIRTGSRANPLVVWAENTGLGGGGPGGLGGGAASTAERDAAAAGGGGLLGRVRGEAAAAGRGAAALAITSMLLPGGPANGGASARSAGLPTSSAASNFFTNFHTTVDRLNPLGSQFDPVGAVFGTHADKAKEQLAGLGKEIQKVGGDLNKLSPKQLQAIHDEAVALGQDKSLTKWSGQLQQVADATTPLARALSKVQADFKTTSDVTGARMDVIRSTVASTSKDIAQKLGAGSYQGRIALAQNYQLAAQAVQGSMDQTGRSTKAGIDYVNRLLTQALKSLGINAVGGAAGITASGGNVQGLISQGQQNLAGGAPAGPVGPAGATLGRAMGGRVPGPVGPDTWTLLDPSGRAAARVGGGELLVANRHSEAALDFATQAVYGRTAGELVAGETTPHSAAPRYAKGGWVRTGATIDPTQGQAPTYSAHGGMSFAELLIAGANAGLHPNLGNLLGIGGPSGKIPMETSILARRPGGGHAYRMWMNDVGSGQAGDRHYTADLHSRIASLLGVSGKGDIEVAADGTSSGAAVRGGRGGGAPRLKAVLVNLPGMTGALAQGAVSSYEAAAQQTLDQLAAQVTGSAGGGGRASGGLPGGHVTGGGKGAYAALHIGRTDQGLDFGGSGPVGAILSGRVTHLGLWPGWPGTGGIVYQTPKGKVYVMEDFAPAGNLHVGSPLRAGEIIGRATGGHSGIETGWANAAGTGPLTPYNGAADGTPMPGGKDFRRFLGLALGGRLLARGGHASPWPHNQAQWNANHRYAYFVDHLVKHGTVGWGPHELRPGHPGVGSGMSPAQWISGAEDYFHTDLHHVPNYAVSGNVLDSPWVRLWNQGRYYAQGGRAPAWGGAFAEGGMLEASQPTLAMFGEGGPETVHFFPRGEDPFLGVFVPPVTPKSSSKSNKQTSWVDPTTGKVVTGTAQQHHQASLQHQQVAIGKRNAAKPHARDVRLGGGTGLEDLGTIDLPGSGEIDITGDMRNLASATWKKIVSGMGKAVGRLDEQGQIDAMLRASRLLEQHPHSQRLKDLLSAVSKPAEQALGQSVQPYLDVYQRGSSRLNLQQQLAEAQGRPDLGPTGMLGLAGQYAFLGNELEDLTGQRSRLTALMKAATQTHNQKLINAVKGQLDQLDDAILQAQVDRASIPKKMQDAFETAMKAIHDKILQGVQDWQSLGQGRFTFAETGANIGQAMLHNMGLDNTALQRAKDAQGGALTPAQIAQARQNLALFTQGVRAEEQPLQGELSGDQAFLGSSQFGALSPTEQQDFRNHIASLQLQLLQLEGTIKDQTDSTNDLVKATDANTTATKQLGGQVAFEYQGQTYTPGGQSSISMRDLSVGV